MVHQDVAALKNCQTNEPRQSHSIELFPGTLFGSFANGIQSNLPVHRFQEWHFIGPGQ